MQIILDTNFLIYCAKNKLDYVEEIKDLVNEKFELVVPSQVIEELNKLKEDKLKKLSGKDRNAADLALKLITHNKIKIIKTNEKTVDDAITNLVNLNRDNIVCTLDRELRKKLRRVILINRFKRLIIKG